MTQKFLTSISPIFIPIFTYIFWGQRSLRVPIDRSHNQAKNAVMKKQIFFENFLRLNQLNDLVKNDKQ